ncbi:hypothetical protein GGR42_003250 [Saonia flava]|uniref:Uncharacterized protein n=1 Tax=Saonia flava TaxID=523696 RepID=A0A846R7L8_9FLAO|nr:hypothetical protein [Saonia flava]NJB72759.1 hypothetical protein [Saonia flava]
MKKVLLFFTLGLFFNFSIAQYAGQVASNMAGAGAQTASAGAIATLDGSINEMGTRRMNSSIKEFHGSPYTSNDFAPTSMFYGDEFLGKVYYRYNAFNEEVEIKKTILPEEKIKSLGRDKALKILVDGKKMGFKTFIDVKGRTLNGYLTELVQGETYDLYRRINVKYTEGQKAQNSFIKAIPNRFSHFTEYYFQQKGVNRMDEISLKNGKLLKLVKEEDKEKLKVFLKENDLNIKDENDLIKVFEFLNKV